MNTGPDDDSHTLTGERLEVVRAAAAYADSWVRLRQRTQRVPGIQVAVAVKGEVLLSGAHGHARLPGTEGEPDPGEALRAGHLFRIASHSKTFTATAVMQLVEQGRLRLDDPVGGHLPELADSTLADRTIGELLAHGGGVVRDTHDSDFWLLEAPFPDRESLIAACHDAADVLPANQQFKYSNIGYGILGLVLESVTGTGYADHVIEHVVRPLGLTDTGPELDPARAGDHVTGYTGLALGEPRLPVDPIRTGALPAATGFYSTAEDLCRYAAAHVLGEPTLLSDATKRRMHRPQWSVPETEEHYALGFGVHRIGERTMIGHGGGFPGQITRTLVDPQDGLTVVVLTNAIDGPALGLAEGIVKLVDTALESHHPHHDRPDGPPLATFTGRFANLWGVADLVDLGGRLRYLAPDQPDPTATIGTLEVRDADTARFSQTSGFGLPGELVRWQREGEATTSVRLGGSTYLPWEERIAALRSAGRVRAPQL
ncbi:MAG: beta-lactamase family protein [Actinomycetota bacterium]|nr:beta-lactamase family protein [Actinomycetota bacterium]